jgi:hypothetical protein
MNFYFVYLQKIQILNGIFMDLGEIQIKADFSLDFDQNYFENYRIFIIIISLLKTFTVHQRRSINILLIKLI